jgi:hypothetical protein
VVCREIFNLTLVCREPKKVEKHYPNRIDPDPKYARSYFSFIQREIHMVKVVIYHLSGAISAPHHLTAISAKNKIYHLSGKSNKKPRKW